MLTIIFVTFHSNKLIEHFAQFLLLDQLMETQFEFLLVRKMAST